MGVAIECEGLYEIILCRWVLWRVRLVRLVGVMDLGGERGWGVRVRSGAGA